MEISYGQGPCDEYYIPPDEDGRCLEGHRFIDDNTGCVPENEFGLPPPECPEAGPEICGPPPPLKGEGQKHTTDNAC
jgi:hypothetical protein